MKLYTKHGDDGSTGLFGGSRVSKSHLRVCAYGSVDETNATIAEIVLLEGVERGARSERNGGVAEQGLIETDLAAEAVERSRCNELEFGGDRLTGNRVDVGHAAGDLGPRGG